VGASALATAEMRHRLSTKLGVRWRRLPSGGWEIDGLPPDVLREFSRRRNEIEEALAELEEAIGRTSTIDERGPFIDRGVSGALASRPALDQIVRLVEDGELQLIVITKLDRIARSLRHLLDLLELLERKGVSPVALDDPLDPSTASGRAMVQLRGVFAELERQLIRERTSEGQRRRLGPCPRGQQSVHVLGLILPQIVACAYDFGRPSLGYIGSSADRGRVPARLACVQV